MNKLIGMVVVLFCALVSTTVMASHIGGPKRIRGLVKEDDMNRHTLFLKGDFTRIQVIGDGDTDLDCFLFDSEANLVGKDDDSTDHCLLQGTIYGGRYTLVVKNLSHDMSNLYVVTTN